MLITCPTFLIWDVNNLYEIFSKVLKYGLLILGAIILIGYFLKKSNANDKFDSKKWKNWTESEKDNLLRWNMINGLLNTYELKGKTKTEIIELLGYPDFETSEYYIGYCLDSPNHNECDKTSHSKWITLTLLLI
ncbi:hypothetical protein D1818_19590 [Aquimarina sp. BL5]|uniref:hypothetical protein n=1 Tax=Aquimarina sp. BL5 TaxID=1714860 RepID=UPI000E514173|nr:hypothetical protein [Aquimarina sp. BL5]AXT52915.1 hypothetical protein D1818_19590 [Aquimarina sp. BL5]RKM93005.1 hypothetical protein D7036_22550 [Aquimarina sp. BL5]